MPSIVTGTRRERKAYPYLLQQLEGPGAPQWIKLDRPELFLGRAEDADIKVPQPASRKHAIFRTEAGNCTVYDNDSRNGVYLNGLRIHSAVLHSKDLIQVGGCLFLFHEA